MRFGPGWCRRLRHQPGHDRYFFLPFFLPFFLLFLSFFLSFFLAMWPSSELGPELDTDAAGRSHW